MSDGASRIVCSRCGSNNFSTQASCWKCGAALAGTTPSTTPASGSSAMSPAQTTNTPFVAAAAMGLIFPLFSVPIGMVFLMLDDPRKSAIGRWNIAWGIVGTILHTVATGLLIQAAAMPMLVKALTSLQKTAP